MKLYEKNLEKVKRSFSKRRARINTITPNFTYKNSKGKRIRLESNLFI
jgi:hypothetical protein